MPSFVFQYRSFTVCLPTVGPEMALSCRHILPLNIDMSGKTWFWGSFPFPRASKLEMSCSILGYVSKKWKSTFGNPCESKIDHEGIFLANLATEYKSCKDKETNKAIRLQLSKQKKVLHWTNTAGLLHSFIWHNIRCIQVTSGCCQNLRRIRS